jgi:Fe-S oxidoreductase
MKFDIFVIPFSAGLAFLFVFIGIKFAKWINALNNNDKRLLRKHVTSRQIWFSVKEIFREALLHKRIIKTNPLLGYMHMSLAFGWLLLIVFGNLEIKFYSNYNVNPPYVPIFLRFFEPNPLPHFFGKGSNFIMDLLLLFILTGVGLAIAKRYNSKSFGLKRTTVHNRFDKVALITLWCIFPFRLLAESFTSGVHHNGSFLTGSLGNIFSSFLPLDMLLYPMWWAYSIALGTFFIALPFSRYMHIPAELILIVFRNAGIRGSKKTGSFAEAEIHACSRCGICIDACQLSGSLNECSVQPSYFIRDVRYKHLQPVTTENCLMCGKCSNICPVGIDSVNLRQTERITLNNGLTSDFSYIPASAVKKTDVLYFAGCMGHLTPTIPAAMTKILNESGVAWRFMDKDGSICCGRPLLLAGMLESANQLKDKNKQLIESSEAKTLVTSCPICYKAFKDEYKLPIEVLHHSQYLLQLINEGRIHVSKSDLNVVYHDPCELGRGAGIYLEPRLVLNQTANLIQIEKDKSESPCCGGSLGNLHISLADKKQLAKDAITTMQIQHADALVTACPMCKKTFETVSDKSVVDIAQVVANSLTPMKTEPLITAREVKAKKELIIK